MKTFKKLMRNAAVVVGGAVTFGLAIAGVLSAFPAVIAGVVVVGAIQTWCE